MRDTTNKIYIVDVRLLDVILNKRDLIRMKIIKLYGLQDVLLLVTGMLAFKYGFLDSQQVELALNDWQYLIMVLACALIAAGGLLINNTAGVGKETTDLSEAKIYNIYIALTLSGVGMGYYIANFIEKPMFSGVFIVGAATLYIYATSLKQTLLISNIVIALLMALPLVAIGIFTLYPVLTSESKPLLATLFGLMLDYALFIFVIGLILTFTNDLAKSDTDYNEGISTLPIAIGRARTQKVVLVFTILPIAMLLYYGETYIKELLFALGYGLLFILAPIIYFVIKLWNAANPKDFRHLETVLKIVLLFTLLSVAVVTFNIQYNVKG
jgi:4-hydroxybenzoate polyprenyltransferase